MCISWGWHVVACTAGSRGHRPLLFGYVTALANQPMCAMLEHPVCRPLGTQTTAWHNTMPGTPTVSGSPKQRAMRLRWHWNCMFQNLGRGSGLHDLLVQWCGLEHCPHLTTIHHGVCGNWALTCGGVEEDSGRTYVPQSGHCMVWLYEIVRAKPTRRACEIKGRHEKTRTRTRTITYGIYLHDIPLGTKLVVHPS